MDLFFLKKKRAIHRLIFTKTLNSVKEELSKFDESNKALIEDKMVKLENQIRKIQLLDESIENCLVNSGSVKDFKSHRINAEKYIEEYTTIKKIYGEIIKLLEQIQGQKNSFDNVVLEEEDSVHKSGKKSTLVAKEVGWFVLKTAAISGAVLGGTALVVPALGFTAGGVAAGSAAAAFQSAFLGGTIASGSAFAVLQSVGAAGLAVSTQAAVVGGSAVVAGAHSVVNASVKYFKRKTSKDLPIVKISKDSQSGYLIVVEN